MILKNIPNMKHPRDFQIHPVHLTFLSISSDFNIRLYTYVYGGALAWFGQEQLFLHHCHPLHLSWPVFYLSNLYILCYFNTKQNSMKWLQSLFQQWKKACVTSRSTDDEMNIEIKELNKENCDNEFKNRKVFGQKKSKNYKFIKVIYQVITQFCTAIKI